MLQKLWYERPLRTQVLIAIAAINLLAALVAGAISIVNTRTATRVEMEASLEVAQRLVVATLNDLASQDNLEAVKQQLPQQLKHLRHVRIMFMDVTGHLTIASPHDIVGDGARPYVPKWFAALVRPQKGGRALRVVTVDRSTPIVIVGEPADEIAEAWQDFSSIAIVWLVLNVIVLAVLYVVLGRVLDPLAHLSKGMLNLEDGHYATRLKPSKVKELAVITNRFNTLAGALDTARDENSRLYRQLITLQEEERREIANELHDEAGPCLFGITANASSIQRISTQNLTERVNEIGLRVGEILTITDRLKAMNRALIKKLRPGPLGSVTLSELIDELTARYQRSHPDTQIQLGLGELGKSYGEPIDLTVYRCIQEGIANAIRHGDPKAVSVDLAETPIKRGRGRAQLAAWLHLTISDDGKGIPPSTPKGFGLATMTERVRSLGGTCVVDSTPAKGTTIRIEIPVRESKERSGAPELVGELS
ncbi:MAG: ATP-binding protein [Methyloceanibacter sp.]|uniref:ATP-binding protein n=1 Tax=Methyloceanibacter sp. TaxID=1965321 RepID=UPI003D6D6F68